MAELVAYFQTSSGAPLVSPATAPTILVARTDDTLDQAATAMVELANAPGWYAFTFATVDAREYVFVCDGDPIVAGQVPATSRFVTGVISGTDVERIEVDVPAILVDTVAGGAGPWTSGAGVTPQAIRDAMKLAPTAGVPAAGSVDEALDNIEADTAAVEPLVSANLDAAVSTLETEASALARAATNQAEHDTTQIALALVETEASAAGRAATNTGEHATTVAAIGTLETEASALARAATNQAEHDTTQIAIAGVETEASALARASTNQTEHDATQIALALVETEASAAIREGTNTAEHATTVAAIGLVETEASALARASTNQTEHDTTQIAIAGVETEAAAAAREATNTAEHATTIAAVALLETEANAAARAVVNQLEHDTTQIAIAAISGLTIADVQTALTAQGYTTLRAVELSEILDHVKNRLEVDFTVSPRQLVLYDRAGTSEVHRWDLNSDGGEEVATQFGVQTKRGVPA